MWGGAVVSERDAFEILGVRRSDSWAEIRAAYRALARRYHADGTSPNRDRMVEINTAYAQLERECLDARRAGMAQPPLSPGVPVGPGQPIRATPPSGSLLGRMAAARHVDTPVVDFGQYAGWRIAEIADHDPRYLRWLSRHSSGHRYRAAIAAVLGPDPEIGRRAALIG